MLTSSLGIVPYKRKTVILIMVLELLIKHGLSILCTLSGVILKAKQLYLSGRMVRQFLTAFAHCICDGDQAQFLERPVPVHRGGQIAPLLDRMREGLDQDWPVDRMAHEQGMSSRTFLRRFHDATGTTPGEWLIAERVEAAKALLCGGPLGIEAVAAAVGFASAHALRHHFRARSGLSPSAYRQQFIPIRG